MKILRVLLAALSATVVSMAAPGWTVPNAQQPQLSATADGTVWLVYGQNGSIFAAESVDGGTSFQAAQQVGELHDLSFGMRRGPRIAAKGDRVTVAVMGEELLAYSSGDRGKTWTGPVTINDVPASAKEGLHDLAIAPDGKLFVVWLDQREGPMELWGAESTDGGKSWAANQRIYRSPEKSICECCHPSALFDADGNLAVMWRNSLGGSRDLWMAVRSRGTATFSGAKKLGTGTWPLDACPMDGGRILALGSGKFGSVWQRAGEVYFAIPGESEVRLGKGRQPIATVRGDKPTVFWQDGTDLVGTTLGSPGGPTKEAANARFAAVATTTSGTTVLVYERPGASGESTNLVVQRR
jgi:hypothetical protein